MSPEGIAAARSLRYRVFDEEMDANPSLEMQRLRPDFDRFDQICDHLLVICKDRDDLPCGVVGTYRILRQRAALQNGGFYSSDEFDLTPLLDFEGEIMALGRSCVDPEYRSRPTMQLLWQAIASYVHRNKIEILFGCASFIATEIENMKLPFSYIYHYHRAPKGLRVQAVDCRFVELNRLPKDDINLSFAWKKLPPLIKGYLRLGGFVGDVAVVDSQFNTTDISIIVKTNLITKKNFFRHYERSSNRSYG